MGTNAFVQRDNSDDITAVDVVDDDGGGGGDGGGIVVVVVGIHLIFFPPSPLSLSLSLNLIPIENERSKLSKSWIYIERFWTFIEQYIFWIK